MRFPIGRLSASIGIARHAGADGPDARESALGFTDPRDPVLAASIGIVGIVAEGERGYANARAVVDSMLRSVNRLAAVRPSDAEALPESLRRATELAMRDATHARRSSSPPLAIAAIAVAPAGLSWASVGDVRIHLVRAGAVHQVNRDRTRGSKRDDLAEQPRAPAIDTAPAPLPLEVDDVIIVGSAGLHTWLSDSAIGDTVAAHRSESSRGLVDRVAALDSQGKTDVSVMHVVIGHRGFASKPLARCAIAAVHAMKGSTVCRHLRSATNLERHPFNGPSRPSGLPTRVLFRRSTPHRRTPPMSRTHPFTTLAAVAFPLLLACNEPSSPASPTPAAVKPAADLLITEIDRVVTEEEFALADKDNTAGICVKGTSSDNLLMKDANAATPSQPCPPAWEFVGKPAAIKIVKEWFTEDGNGNGMVCVKFVGDDKTIVKDDNDGTPSEPCPPAFNPVGKAPSGPKVEAGDLQAADENANGLVCVNALASGNFIVRDDNDATPSQPCPPSYYSVAGGTPVESK